MHLGWCFLLSKHLLGTELRLLKYHLRDHRTVTGCVVHCEKLNQLRIGDTEQSYCIFLGQPAIKPDCFFDCFAASFLLAVKVPIHVSQTNILRRSCDFLSRYIFLSLKSIWVFHRKLLRTLYLFLHMYLHFKILYFLLSIRMLRWLHSLYWRKSSVPCQYFLKHCLLLLIL